MKLRSEIHANENWSDIKPLWTNICKEKEYSKRKQVMQHIEGSYQNIPYWGSYTKKMMNNAERKDSSTKLIWSFNVQISLNVERV